MMRVPTALGGRPPAQANLDELFAGAARFELRARDGASGRDGALIAEGAGAAAAELHAALRIRPPSSEGFRCMCRGDMGLLITRGDGTRVTLGLHHGAGIRHEPWSSDAELADARAFASFLEAHGVAGALAAHDHAHVAGARIEGARDAFAEAAPEVLRAFARELPTNAPSPFAQRLDAHIAALVAAHGGDRHAAQRELLAWAGSSPSQWDTYPAYESVPIAMLGRMELDRALDAHLASEDERVLRGLGRYIATRGLSLAGTEALARGLDPARRARLLRAAEPFDVHGHLTTRTDPEAVAVRVPAGARLAHVFEDSHGFALASDGERLYAVDGRRIVRFDPGVRRPVVLHTLGRDARAYLAAGPSGIAAAENERVFALTPAGEARTLATLRHPPDALFAGRDHVVWATNSDPGNPIGRTYALERIAWTGGEPATVIPPSEDPPYGYVELGGRAFVLQRTRRRGFLGRERRHIALREVGAAGAAPLAWQSAGGDMLGVAMAAQPVPDAATSGEEPPALWLAEGRTLHELRLDGGTSRVRLDTEAYRLAASAHGPVFMAQRGDFLRIEQRTVLRAPRYLVELPRLPWPSSLLAQGDRLWIAVGSAVLEVGF